MEAKTDHRLPAIDLLRGLVMVLMALDHTRDFFSDSVRTDPGYDPAASPALFFTRWFSHFCAPVFIFLAGVGASLAGDRMTKPQLARFLLIRGLWLIVLELTLVRWGWWFNRDYHLIILMVIWVIGASMIVLAGLVFAPRPLVGLFGFLLVVCQHYWSPYGTITADTLAKVMAVLLYQDGGIPLPNEYLILAPYKVIPWCGVMALGYAVGPVFRWPAGYRRGTWTVVGIAMLFAFVLFRAMGRFDPWPWTLQYSVVQNLMSFLRCLKYPPSFCYLLMTLGPAFIALDLFDRPPGWLGRRLIVFGRVPLFFYLLHLPLIHGLAILVDYCRHGSINAWLLAPAQDARAPEGYGFSLSWVYLAWAIVVVLLYPPCAWFAECKRRARGGWWSYF